MSVKNVKDGYVFRKPILC